jgi:hypothetical protein
LTVALIKDYEFDLIKYSQNKLQQICRFFNCLHLPSNFLRKKEKKESKNKYKLLPKLQEILVIFFTAPKSNSCRARIAVVIGIYNMNEQGRTQNI